MANIADSTTALSKSIQLLNADADGLVSKFAELSDGSKVWNIASRLLSGSGLWQLQNRVRALGNIISVWNKANQGAPLSDVETLIRNQISSTWYFNHGQMYEQAMRLNDEKMIKARISLPERFVPINPGIKAYLPKMNKSEILLVMIGGMATVAGGVLAAYIAFLGGDDPAQRIEVAKNRINDFLLNSKREKTLEYLLSLGFSIVSLDIEGLVSGKLNREHK